MNARLRVLLIALALPATVAVGGCGGDAIDPETAAIAVKYDVQEKTGTEVAEVVCPSDVAVRPGNEFACEVTAADGAEALAELEVVNESADVRLVELRAADADGP